MGREARARRAAAEAEDAEDKKPGGQNGVERDRDEDGGSARRSRTQEELRRHAAPLVLAALLVALSLVAVWLPSWGVPLGTLLGGGSRVTLDAVATDGSDASADDMAAAGRALAQRASGLAEKGVGVSVDGASVNVDVPASYDAATVASSISGTGKVEFVRVDAIGDADALAKLEAGTRGVKLAEGTYEPFATSDNVTSASVVSGKNPYNGTTIWAVSVTLDADGTSALATATDDASSSSYVAMAVVVDGTVVATPTSSSKIESGKMTVSGGFTESSAHALAAELSSGTIPVTFSANVPEHFQAAFGGHALRAAGVAALALAVVAGLVASFAFGRGGWLLAGSGLVAVALSLGVLTLLARFDYVILGTLEAVIVALAGVVSAAAAAWSLVAYRAARARGASVRKAQQDGGEGPLGLASMCLAVSVAVSVVLAVFGPEPWRAYAWAASAALFGALVTIPVLTSPLFVVLTAHDANGAAALAVGDADADDAAAADAGDAHAVPAEDEPAAAFADHADKQPAAAHDDRAE